MATWLVVKPEDGGWEISRDGLVVETLRSHYDAHEVLQVAERAAGWSLTWKLTPDGFESVAVLEG